MSEVTYLPTVKSYQITLASDLTMKMNTNIPVDAAKTVLSEMRANASENEKDQLDCILKLFKFSSMLEGKLKKLEKTESHLMLTFEFENFNDFSEFNSNLDLVLLSNS